MTDVFSPAQRSEVMRKVKSRGNASTELRLIALFRARGIKGWRRAYPLQGKPDFVFPKKRIAVFADGCFWHGHPCRKARPQQNQAYWEKKIARNQVRDKEVTAALQKKGWMVIRIWECQIKRGEINWCAFEREAPGT